MERFEPLMDLLDMFLEISFFRALFVAQVTVERLGVFGITLSTLILQFRVIFLQDGAVTVGLKSSSVNPILI